MGGCPAADSRVTAMTGELVKGWQVFPPGPRAHPHPWAAREGTGGSEEGTGGSEECLPSPASAPWL